MFELFELCVWGGEDIENLSDSTFNFSLPANKHQQQLHSAATQT